MTFQPYLEAEEEEKKHAELPLKLAKKGAAIAGGGITKIFPFLSLFVPETIARKAINKLAPKVGKFFNEAEKAGHSFDEGREFISKKMSPIIEEEQMQQPQNAQEAMRMNLQRAQNRKPPSEFSREALQNQFQQGQQQQSQGKAALLQTMQEITETLRRLRGQGG